ncbi:MAG: hypothetical protein WD114_01875 [Phycisphaerales bacterium]
MHHGRAGLLLRLAVAVLLASAIAGLPGCRVIKKWFNPADEVELTGERAGPAVASSSPGTGDRQGLEVRLLVVDDTRYDAPRLLNELSGGDDGANEDGEGIDAATRQRWGAWGLRLVSIPRESVDSMLGELRPVQPVSVQWLGEFGAWRGLVRAGELPTTVVRVGDSTRRIEERGRPRLIARSWMEPRMVGGDVLAGVRLDLGMQIESLGDRLGPGLNEPGRVGTIDDEGPVIDELLCSLLLDGDRALVIVGEEPGVRWDELPEPELIDETIEPDEDEDGEEDERRDRGAFGPTIAEERAREAERRGEDGQTARGAGQNRDAGQIEPARPRERTLGELMLMSPGSRIVRLNESRVVPRRVIVVLIPHGGGSYRLLPGGGVVEGIGGGG